MGKATRELVDYTDNELAELHANLDDPVPGGIVSRDHGRAAALLAAVHEEMERRGTADPCLGGA